MWAINGDYSRGKCIRRVSNTFFTTKITFMNRFASVSLTSYNALPCCCGNLGKKTETTVAAWWRRVVD